MRKEHKWRVTVYDRNEFKLIKVLTFLDADLATAYKCIQEFAGGDEVVVLMDRIKEVTE